MAGEWRLLHMIADALNPIATILFLGMLIGMGYLGIQSWRSRNKLNHKKGREIAYTLIFFTIVIAGVGTLLV